MLDLTPERGLIFRITHVNNVPWLLKHGLHCATSGTRDPSFVQIGLPDLIDRRRTHALPAPFAGFLSDYVPFYFTPSSIMLYKILTGNGVPRRRSDEIVVLVSSLQRLADAGLPYVFSDRHAVLAAAHFANDPAELVTLPWHHLRNRIFRRDPDDPESFERYQAEALVRTHMPPTALLGMACANNLAAASLSAIVQAAGLDLRVLPRPTWYF